MTSSGKFLVRSYWLFGLLLGHYLRLELDIENLLRYQKQLLLMWPARTMDYEVALRIFLV